jgi:signal transduction histidine kinase
LTLSRKISFSFLASAVFLTAACVGILYHLGKIETEKNVISHLSTTAQSRADNIELFLGEHAGQAELTALDDAFRELLLARDGLLDAGETPEGGDPPQRERYERALAKARLRIERALEGDGHFVGMSIIDRNGTVLASNSGSLTGVSVGDDDRFILALDDTYIDDLYLCPTHHTPILGIYVPVRVEGELLGITFLELSAEEMFRILLDDTGLGETGEAYLVNGSGYMISPSRDVPDVILKMKVDSENLARCWSHRDDRHLPSCTDIGVFKDYSGETVFGTHHYIPRMQWALLAEMDSREALAPLKTLNFLAGGFLVAVPLVAFLIGSYVSRSIAKPVDKLREGARAIGEGDFSYRVRATSADEIGELGRAFDEMAEGLGKATTTIDRLNAEIAERQKAQRALVRLERLKALEEMAAGISHNLNNILVGVLGHAQLLEDSTDNPAVLDEVRAIVKSARRAENLVDRLTLAVRGEDAELGPVDVSVLAQEVVNGTLRRLKDDSAKGDHGFRIRIESGYVPLARASRSGVVQILNNLIQNSIEAMPAGGDITVGLEGTDDFVTLTVADTGDGMESEVSKRVMEPFFTTKAEVGKGLGLSTVYGLVTRWGGRVTVDSEPGKGCKVCVTLPVWWRSGAAGGQSEPDSGDGRDDIGVGRVLIVDDEDVVTRTLLDGLGDRYEVVVASDGQEALDLLSSREFSVALIDLGLPGMPGDMLAVRLKEQNPDMVIVLMTGWNIGEGDPMVEGFDLWLRKPFESLNHVREVIRRAYDLFLKRSSGLHVA